MSFTANIKNEICNLNSTEIEKISELSAIISNSTISKDYIKITTENNVLANHILDLLVLLFNIEPKITVRKGYNYNKNYIYILELTDTSILNDLGISNSIIPKNYIISDSELEKSYLKGLFLISGSVNDPKKSRYHLEFLVNDLGYASFVSKLLNKYYLNSKVIKRENKYMVYMKGSEKIGDFLRIIKASKAVLYYEDMRIYRDHKNMTNRLNNCEQANVDKIIATAEEQLKNIELINNTIGLNCLSEKEQIAAIYRLKYRDCSLQELSEIISLETNDSITKSGLHHRFNKIKDLASKIKEKM